MSEYYNPVRESLIVAKRLDSISFCILIISTLLTLTNFIFNNYFISLKEWAEIISNINTVFIILYAMVKFGINYIVFNSSFQKRADFIDNSFNTNYTTKRSNKYYNNNEIAPGILRMGANSFESCFFTYNLSIKSIKEKWIINLIIIIIIISLALQGYNSVLSMVLQLSLPLILISEAINYSIFCLRMKNILDSFCRVYNDLIDEPNKIKKEAEVILNVLNYETTKSTFNLLISEKTYKKYNPKLSESWESLKLQYKLK